MSRAICLRVDAQIRDVSTEITLHGPCGPHARHHATRRNETQRNASNGNDETFRRARKRTTASDEIHAQMAHIWNETVPIQLAQCRWFPGLASSSGKILIYFSNKIYGSNFVKQHSETVLWFEITKMLIAV